MDHPIGERQRWAWLAGGLSAAVAACGCGISWIWVLTGGLLTAGYYIYMDGTLHACGLAAILPRPVAALTWIWTVTAMAWAANLADRAFPMVDGFPLLGWVMLALAAWGSRKGAAACARCAGVLCLFLLFLYGVVAVFAMPDVKLENLRPVGTWTDIGLVLGLFLLPASVWYVPFSKRKKKRAWGIGLLLPVAAAILAGVTAGVLSPQLAAAWSVPLYTLAQSVSLFGVVERIEPLLSAAMVMGVFCLLSAMACACGSLADRIKPCKIGGVASCVIAGICMAWAGKMDFAVLAAGGIVFWAFVPLLAVWTNSVRGGRRNGTCE